MSYSTIYFIGLTVVFAIYYLALMYLDMKAKKEEKSDVETIDVPEPAPDAPPTEVEETDDGYVIRNGKNGKSQFKPVKMQSDAEFTHEQMQLIMANGGDTSDGNKITQTRIRV